MVATNDLNGWLEYSIQPQQLRTLLRPAIWVNGQLELLAELDLLLSADGILSATVDGIEVATSSDRKLALPWRLFEDLPKVS